MDLQLDNLGILVQHAIAPAFLVGAAAMQLRVLNNRLTRIVDRQRWLDKLPAATRADPVRAAAFRHETEVLRRRQRSIHRAIFLCASCALLVCCVIAVLFLDEAFDAGMDWMIAVLFVASMACLVLSYLFFLDEIFVSIRKLRLTIRGSRQLPD